MDPSDKTKGAWSKTAANIAACTANGSKKICNSSVVTGFTGGAKLSKTGTFDQGAKITVDCPANFDHTTASVKEYTCGLTSNSAAAKWSVAPSGKTTNACERKTCLASIIASRGNVKLSGNAASTCTNANVDVGKKCDLECDDKHYGATKVTAALECKADAGWSDIADASGVISGCSKKKCDPHSGAPANATFKKLHGNAVSDFADKELIQSGKVKAVCDEGYTGFAFYKCQDTGTIVKTEEDLVCESNTCSIADLNSKLDDLKLNAKVKGTSNTPIEHDQTTTIECKDGFTGEDKPSPKCHRGTGWPDAEITCTATDGSATATVNAIAAVVAGAAFIF